MLLKNKISAKMCSTEYSSQRRKLEELIILSQASIKAVNPTRGGG